MEIQDKELKKMLGLAGIPKSYQREDASLSKCGKFGEAVLDWLSSGGYAELRKGSSVIEIVSDKPEATDAFYCMARAAILHGIPVQAYHVLDMLNESQLNEEVWEDTNGVHALFIEGFSGERNDQTTSAQDGILEWFLSRWLMDGKSIVFLHDVQIAQGPLTKRFKKRIALHHKVTLTNL
jgi:hypothetical protein